MPDDWLLKAIDEVLRAADAARLELSAAGAVLTDIRRERSAGGDVVSVAESLSTRGLRSRVSVADSLREYERAVAALRAEVICALVDDVGATVSGLARRMGISRQSVSRLYEAGAAHRRPSSK